MSRVEKLFNALVYELSNGPTTARQDLLNCTRSLLDVLPVAANLRSIQDYKLLQGLLFTQSELWFFERLTKEAEQKQSLASYCLKECELGAVVRRFRDGEEPVLRRFFFECGSTIAHTIGRFAEDLSDAQQKRSAGLGRDCTPPILASTVVTNNLTGVTALAGLVEELEPIQGRLSLKYFGFIPFAEEDTRSDWRAEGKRFNLLAEDIQSCEAVFATCSNFSFVAGPIVGGRDNCIAKRAMYCGAERWDDAITRRFYLLFHFQKSVPLIDTYNETFESPGETCGCVFAPPSSDMGRAINNWRLGYDEDDPIASPSFDGSWHDQLRNLAVHGRHPSLMSIRIPIEKFNQATEAARVRMPHKLETSWLDWLQHSTGFNILISLPRESAKASLHCIEEEVRRANQVLEIATTGVQYVVKNAPTAVSDLVVHVAVTR